MKKVLLQRFSLSIIFALISFVFASSLLAQNVSEAEEYSVYKSLFQQEFIGKETKELVIKKQTAIENFSDNEPIAYLIKSLPSLTKETIEDFRLQNKKPTELTNKFNLKVKINLLGEEFDRLFYEARQSDPEKDGWEIFYKKYPTSGGIITLSRVGFNKEKSQALMFVSHGCGSLCGEGNYILLIKKDNVWKVEQKLMMWIS